MNYLAENWLALLSLVIALLGGVPGIITAITHFKNKPKFYYSLANVVTGELHRDDKDTHDSMILLSGTVANDGPQPLSPDHFELSMEINGVWRSFERSLIPEGAQFQSNEQDIQIKEPWKRDLQKFSGGINKGQPIHGFLMFVSTTITAEQIRESINNDNRMKLTCIDIYKKEHSMVFKPEVRKNSVNTVYPKHGVSISKKT